VHQLAVAIGVSISPVRDAIERLVGERLIAPRGGGGFKSRQSPKRVCAIFIYGTTSWPEERFAPARRLIFPTNS